MIVTVKCPHRTAKHMASGTWHIGELTMFFDREWASPRSRLVHSFEVEWMTPNVSFVDPELSRPTRWTRYERP